MEIVIQEKTGTKSAMAELERFVLRREKQWQTSYIEKHCNLLLDLKKEIAKRWMEIWTPESLDSSCTGPGKKETEV